jgi:DNA-binding CsgD family transcriptional regulator
MQNTATPAAGDGLPKIEDALRRADRQALAGWSTGIPTAALEAYAVLPEGPVTAPSKGLSPRETEVMAWVARGKSNSVIADILGISSHTVDAHLRRAYSKLGVYERVSATVRYLRL